MISMKDIIALATLAGIVVPGGIYVHDIKRDVIVLSSDFLGSQLRDNQKSLWQYEDRIKTNPNDNTARERLRQLEYEQKLLEYKQKRLKKEGP